MCLMNHLKEQQEELLLLIILPAHKLNMKIPEQKSKKSLQVSL